MRRSLTAAALVGAVLVPLAGCSDGAQSPWRAPLLIGTEDLSTVVELKGRIVYGSQTSGQLAPGGPTHGFLLDALEGARVVARLTQGTSAHQAVAVYGPRSHQGIFGKAIAVAGAGEGGTSGVRVEATLPARGVYLVLVGDTTGAGGTYALALDCTGDSCGASSCESAVCALVCQNGFRRDGEGCEVCACADGTTSLAPGCVDGTSCGAGHTCRQGRCQECACTDAFSPVCGKDGTTYASPCDLACAGVELASTGACAPAPCGTGPACNDGERCVEGRCVAEAVCSCPETYAPVCGTDKKTYGNRCLLDCAGVGLAGDGACVATASGCQANCVADSDCGAAGVGCRSGFCTVVDCDPNQPVCGSDGVSYSSACEIAWCRGVTVAAEGACCQCPGTFAPVCGADGKTYSSECEARCAGAAVASEGACASTCGQTVCTLDCPFGLATDPGTGCEICACKPGPACTTDVECAAVSTRMRCIENTCQIPCVCPFVGPETSPVCGTDGNTYASACFAACSGVLTTADGCAIRTLVGDCRAECEDPIPRHICGANGVTYPSECELCRAGAIAAYDGTCDPFPLSNCSCDEAPDSPVCGDDGLTYANQCLAECAGTQIASEEPCLCAASRESECTLDCPNGRLRDKFGCLTCECNR